MKIPFIDFKHMHQPLKEEMMKSFETAFDQNAFVLGENVAQFEKEYAKFNQTKFAIGVSNGLDALFISLKALGIKTGDEVIVPSNTYIASLLAISHCGAKPVLVEPDPIYYNLKPENIEAVITSNTKAIMPVHLYGQACEMDKIMAIAKKHHLYVVEDNAQAHGSTFKGQLTGSFGDLAATSFYPGKNLGALGDGGCIVSNDENLAEKVKILRNYGSPEKYVNTALGYNMRLDNIQAGFLNIKLQHLTKWTAERKKIADWYKKHLANIEGITLPKTHPDADHVYHLFIIKTDKRNQLQNFLKNNGVDTIIHYPIPPHLQKAYEYLGYKKGDFPIAEALAETVLSLPLWPGMTEIQVKYVAQIVSEFFTKNH